MNTINMTAGENLTAGDLVSAYFGTQVRKTIRRFTTATQVGTTTGLDSSTTQRMIKTIHTANGYSVVVYKKSADNKLYATVSKFNAIDLVPIV